MARATHLLRAAVVLLAGVAAAAEALSGGAAATDSGKRATNSFTLVYAATPRNAGPAPSMGVGVPGKPVVTNPYNVPLLQNAGTLGSAR
jgi:hypothetical protein